MKNRLFIILMVLALGLPLACDTFTADPTISPILKIHPPVPTVTSTRTLTRTATPTITWSPTVTTTVMATAGTCAFLAVTQWGGPGAGNGQFNNLADVAVDSSGNLYALDAGNKRVQKFDSTGTYLAQWNAGNTFLVPSNIGLIDSVSKVYVLDISATPTLHDVVKVSNEVGVGYPGWTVPLNSRGLAVDNQANVYIGEQTIAIRFDQAGFNPLYYYNQGVPGALFSGIQALVVDPNRDLFVAVSSSIQKFNSSGQYVSRWGSPGSGNGQFSGIGYMATDSQGNVFVVDNPVSGGVLSGRVQKFDNNGNFICDYRVTATQLVGLAFDSSGNLFIADTTNSRVLKFTP